MKFLKKFLRLFKKKLVIFFLVLLILAGIILLIMHTLNKPAIGVINQSAGQQTVEQAPLKEFKNKYFKTKYSSRYSLKENQNSSASLQSWMLTAKQNIGGNTSANIAVNVAKQPAGGVKEDSDYKQFEAFPKLYKISRSTFNLESVVIANRTDPNFEQTALWAHGDYLLSVSMTATNKTDQLITEMDAFLVNLTWVE